jgi:two-component system, chemotaxis family, CheB/CheR fusion protein
MTEEVDRNFEALLEYLRQNRGFDFTGYKRPSLMRRVSKRMQDIQIETFEDYVDYLEVHPEEFYHLFDTILINVTAFFRDTAAWEYLGNEIIPRILAAKKDGGLIRIWSAGCASGEEPYSLAMLFAETMGEDGFRERVKIYASEVDEAALTVARQGKYSANATESLSSERKERFFERSNSHLVFRSDLRRAIIFGRHDLLKDAPISRLDLLVCRNSLMYFNADIQSRILSGFHFALNDDGFLFLGKAELLFAHMDLFLPVDLKYRVFIKAQTRARERWTANPQSDDPEINHRGSQFRLRDAAFDVAPVARLVVNANGQLAMMTQSARELFALSAQDIGRPLQDLEISYRPVELRSLVEHAHGEKGTVLKSGVERRTGRGEVQHFDVVVTPLYDNGTELGTSITFLDVTQQRRLQATVEDSTKKLEIAYQDLQSAHEELETTNEELQSTNEELQTTNEELQSSNEELETMNEELQSTNEELRTMNDMLRQRTDEINTARSFLDSILDSVRVAAVVLDPDYNIMIWNKMAEEMWGLRADEIKGSSFFKLDIGLEVGKLREAIRACQVSGTNDDLVFDAINRRGRSISCRITVTKQRILEEKDRGVILLFEEVNGQAEA